MRAGQAAAGKADNFVDALLLHGRHNVLSAAGLHVGRRAFHLPEHAHHHVGALRRAPHGLGIEHVARNNFQLRRLHIGQLGGGAHQGPDAGALGQGLGQKLPAGLAGGAEKRNGRQGVGWHGGVRAERVGWEPGGIGPVALAQRRDGYALFGKVLRQIHLRSATH